MAITVTLSLADGPEAKGFTIGGQDGDNIFVTVQNLSASAVNVTSASVYFTSPTTPGIIGAMVLPQGGVSIPGSTTITLPPVSYNLFLPQVQGQTAASAGSGLGIGATVQVSDGSVGTATPASIAVTPFAGGTASTAGGATGIPPNYGWASSNASIPTVIGGTQYAYTNTIGPGMLNASTPLQNSELYLFPSLFAFP